MADKDTYTDPSTGKKYKLSEFDDRASWSRVKKKKSSTIKDSSIPSGRNILGKV